MMIRKAIGVTSVWAILSSAGAAEQMKRVDFTYREGFEGAVPEFTLWAKNGRSTVNFMGPTEETAFEGKRSFKLDVTLDGGSYHYWGVSLVPPVPCEGKLVLSARIRLGEGSTARVGFGCNMAYPPSRHSGCGPFSQLKQPSSEWQLMSADLVERGTLGRDSVLRRETVNVTGADVGAVVDRWSIFVYGKAGDRAIVYLDDVRLEGTVPPLAAYEADAKARFEAVAERFARQVAGWRRRFVELSKNLDALDALPPAVRVQADLVRSYAERAEKSIAAFAKTGYAGPMEITRLNRCFDVMRYGPGNVAAMARIAAQGDAFALVANNHPITDTRPPPDTPPLSVPLATSLSVSGCPGEYESVSVVVYALEKVSAVRVAVSDLKGRQGSIPASAVDVRVVKWWYQGEGGIAATPNKEYKPELLLKDDRLVKVDREKQSNYLRSTAPDGSRTYVLCSGKSSAELAEIRPLDATTLQPLDIAAGTLREFWVNLNIPADALPGEYAGKLTFAPEGGRGRSIPLQLTVHPFPLLPSPLVYSIYYRAKLSPDGRPTITSERKSEEQYRAEIANMKAHGVLYPTNYQNWHETLLPKVLDIRRQLGLPTDAFYNLGQSTGNTSDPERLVELRASVGKWLELCRKYGYRDVYFYGMDEARGDRLKSQRMTWKAVQDAGGKTFVACYKKTFEAMGSLLNCAVLARAPDPEEGKKWHSVGSQVFCYANPQVGEEKPETYRRNFGLVLWQAGFDGAMNYAYQHGFGHVWNDFDSPRYRDHNFTYPTLDGVVDTLAWEGFREGVDDVRYVATLEAAIQDAAPDKAAVAKQAAVWLADLLPREVDLDAMRARTVDWIRKLR